MLEVERGGRRDRKRRRYYEIKRTSVYAIMPTGLALTIALDAVVVKVSVPVTRHFLTPKHLLVFIPTVTNLSKGYSARFLPRRCSPDFLTSLKKFIDFAASVIWILKILLENLYTNIFIKPCGILRQGVRASIQNNFFFFFFFRCLSQTDHWLDEMSRSG